METSVRERLEARIEDGKANGEDVSMFEEALASLVELSKQPSATKTPRKTKAEKAICMVEEIVYDTDGVQVIKVRGKPMCFRMLRGGELVDETTCAPQSWRTVQQQVVERAAAL